MAKTYMCTVCGEFHGRKRDMKACQKLPVPEQMWQAGDTIIDKDNSEMMIASVLVKLVSKKADPRHEIIYGYRILGKKKIRYVQQRTLTGFGLHLKVSA